MIKILICDDEKQWVDLLEQSISRVLKIEYEIHSFLNSADLLNYLETDFGDIIILDIQLPNTNGIEVAKQIYKTNKHSQLIFTSVSVDYIQDVFSVKPIFYLVKPFIDEKVQEALYLAIDNLDCQKQNIKVVTKGKTVSLLINELDYVESNKRVVNFHHNNEITPCLMKLDDVCNMLPNEFVRCHQSYLVNINSIARISNNEIELHSGIIIPVAKSRFSQTKKLVLEFWENQL